MDVPWVGLLLALLIGVLLGTWYFGALFWTVRRLPTSRNPGLLTVSSFLVRNILVIAGLLWLVERHWLALLTALVGVMISRQVAVILWGPPSRPHTQEQKSHGHD